MKQDNRAELLAKIRDPRDGLILDPITCDVIPEDKVYFLNTEDDNISYASIETLYKNLVINRKDNNPYTRQKLENIEEIYEYGMQRKVTIYVTDKNREYKSKLRQTVFLVEWFTTLRKVCKKALKITRNNYVYMNFDICFSDGSSFYDLDPATEISTLVEKSRSISIILSIEPKHSKEEIAKFLDIMLPQRRFGFIPFRSAPLHHREYPITTRTTSTGHPITARPIPISLSDLFPTRLPPISTIYGDIDFIIGGTNFPMRDTSIATSGIVPTTNERLLLQFIRNVISQTTFPSQSLVLGACLVIALFKEYLLIHPRPRPRSIIQYTAAPDFEPMTLFFRKRYIMSPYLEGDSIRAKDTIKIVLPNLLRSFVQRANGTYGLEQFIQRRLLRLN